MSLRIKILSGFIFLTAILAAAAVLSIVELNTIGMSVTDLIEDNYKSIQGSKQILQAIEKEEHGVLLLLTGHNSDGLAQLTNGDSLYRAAYRVVLNNITIDGEERTIQSIHDEWKSWKVLMSQFPEEPENRLAWYTRVFQPQGNNIRCAVRQLSDMNDTTLYSTATSLKDKTRMAVTPSIVSVLAALIFVFIFNFFIDLYVASPLVRITRGVQDSLRKGLKYHVQINSDDELSELNNALYQLVRSREDEQ